MVLLKMKKKQPIRIFFIIYIVLIGRYCGTSINQNVLESFIITWSELHDTCFSQTQVNIIANFKTNMI